MVAGALPQLNVMTPPAETADCSALNVQLATVPVPTTVVGEDVLAGCPRAGIPVLHEPLGLPACIPPSEVPLDDPPAPLLLPPPELELEEEVEPELPLELELELVADPEPDPELGAPEPPLEDVAAPASPLAEPEPLPQPATPAAVNSVKNVDPRTSAATVWLAMTAITIAPACLANHGHEGNRGAQVGTGKGRFRGPAAVRSRKEGAT